MQLCRLGFDVVAIKFTMERPHNNTTLQEEDFAKTAKVCCEGAHPLLVF